MLQNKGKAETGYYNERCPIVSLGKPENTMSEKTFENHYSEIECRRKLQEYLLSKHAPAKQESKKEDPKKGERLPGTFLPEDQLKFF